MSNFTFLNAKPFTELYAAATKAEERVNNDPATAAMHARLTLETAVHWLYDNAPNFRRPGYDHMLNALLTAHSFTKNIRPDIVDKCHTIRKIGNDAVHHNGVKIGRKEALVVVRELFHITYWIARRYGDPAQRSALPQTFDESLLPPSTEAVKKLTIKQRNDIAVAYQLKRDELEEEQAKNADLQAENERLRAQVAQQLIDNEKADEQEPDTHDYQLNEADTREVLIDTLLRESGWIVPGPNHPARNPGGVSTEFPVTGMPNKSKGGKGRVDYVLWGDDGKPLAIIEAKGATISPEKGKRQAELYADRLEEAYQQRPIIFYTNGRQTFLWDDQPDYPPRIVYGFYRKDELSRLILRRSHTTPLDQVPTNKDIATRDRDYQEEAIRAVTDRWKNNHRTALLAMATGSGKTRTTIALVDVLMRAGVVKRALFLADRTALVNQAVKNFKSHLPDTPPVNLVTEKIDARTARLVISTYHTMMGAIEERDSQDPNSGRMFSPGHFDLVVIDEAHRSVYRSFRAIFDYFDAFLLGLTATPKEDVDKNTYDLFKLPPGLPTFAYTLSQAVAEGHLVDYAVVTSTTKFLDRGIKYSELSEEEKEDWDAQAWEMEEPPTSISPGDLNKWLFNQDTVDKVLINLMENGHKVAGGDQLGKTIIFARNKKHAEFIIKRFYVLFPDHGGKFIELIADGIPYVQTLIDDFGEPHKMPQIAASIDMLDTGIDVPEVVNLVFFKPVYSQTKFHQMIGRGTRLCKDLYGPDKDKTDFLIFDPCQNFAYFDENPKGRKASKVTPLTERIFKRRVELLEAIQPQAAQDPDSETAALAKQLRNQLHQQVAGLNQNHFQVRPQMANILPFLNRPAWDNLSPGQFADLEDKIAPLPYVNSQEEHESAKRVDNLILAIQNALIAQDQATLDNGCDRLADLADQLAKISTVPKIKKHLSLIRALQGEPFYATLSLPKLEEVRLILRALVDILRPREQKMLYTNFRDEMGELMIKESGLTYNIESAPGVNLSLYRRKVEQFIKESEDFQLYKLRQGILLDGDDLEQLEQFFYGLDLVNGRETFEQAYKDQDNLAVFIRKTKGLDKNAARLKFARYLDDKVFSVNQIRFVQYIIDRLASDGFVELGELYDRPFTDISASGLDGVFKGPAGEELAKLVKEANRVLER
ncbi:MAG: DEAD/DEAH box helicase family protein [Chloroflexota bacterium]